MIRAVLDTNIIISGMLWSGSPRRIIDAAESGIVKPVINEAMLDELRDVNAVQFLERLARGGE